MDAQQQLRVGCQRIDRDLERAAEAMVLLKLLDRELRWVRHTRSASRVCVCVFESSERTGSDTESLLVVTRWIARSRVSSTTCCTPSVNTWSVRST